MKTLYLTYSNHNDKSTTEDFLTYFNEFFKPFNIILTEKIQKNEINLIIEEFTNEKFIKELKFIKENFPKTKILLIFTEYFNHKGFKVFNNFDLRFVDIVFFEFYIYIYSFLRLCKKSFYKLIYSINGEREIKINVIEKFKSKFFFNSINNYRYMRSRLEGFIKVKDIIDLHLIWNIKQKENMIKNGINEEKIKIIYPFVNIIKKRNQYGMTISGEKTKYRLFFIKKILNTYKIRNNFDLFLNSQDFYYKSYFLTYSINPKKELNWKYPSLFRYLFSIYNNEIPLIVDDFDCELTKYLSLRINKEIEVTEINKKEFLENAYDKINSKIIKYNEVLYEPNKIKFIKTLLQI
jgi:hypothetical protein